MLGYVAFSPWQRRRLGSSVMWESEVRIKRIITWGNINLLYVKPSITEKKTKKQRGVTIIIIVKSPCASPNGTSLATFLKSFTLADFRPSTISAICFKLSAGKVWMISLRSLIQIDAKDCRKKNSHQWYQMVELYTFTMTNRDELCIGKVGNY